jgi:hypothetical protein
MATNESSIEVDTSFEVAGDPKFEYYMDPATTQQQRDIVFQSAIFFVGRPPKTTSPPYATVVQALNIIFSVSGNGNAQQPISLRFASGKQIGNFLHFIQAHANVIWNGLPPAVRMHCKVEDSEYFQFTC